MRTIPLLKTLVTAGTLLAATATLSSAATVLDQSNDASTATGFATFSSLDWQQKVVAGVDGILDSIELQVFGSADFDVYINLGSGWQSDTDDFSTSLTGVSGFFSIDVSGAGISLTSGDEFSIGVRNGNAAADLRGSSGNLYSDGDLYLDGSLFSTDLDLNFRTNVTTTTVPLPAGLPLLALGLGSVAVLRRKKKA